MSQVRRAIAVIAGSFLLFVPLSLRAQHLPPVACPDFPRREPTTNKVAVDIAEALKWFFSPRDIPAALPLSPRWTRGGRNSVFGNRSHPVKVPRATARASYLLTTSIRKSAMVSRLAIAI